MSMRSIASATISFGAVLIPVKAYLSAAPENISFKMITSRGNKVRQTYSDAETGEEIDQKDTFRGFEISKDEFVLFTNEELNMLYEQKKEEIVIDGFFPSINILPHQVERTLHLAPDVGADRAYRLLSHCMSKTKTIAVGKFYLRNKDHLIAIVAENNRLQLHQLFYSKEIRKIELNFEEDSEPTKREIALGRKLIDNLTRSSLDFSSYKDEYIDRVREAAMQKKTGQEISVKKKSKTTSSLIEFLQKSIDD